MEDGNKQPHTFGNGQQRTHHPRPFFYVQPPSQPYYVYQHWQLNNPYSHYGLPGGFNYNRPFMPPYQYMQYPGYGYPQAPMYPVDNRRMFEPRFHAPPWSQQPYSQPPMHREMACSEAQTDPSDAITKLIECLDKIRASELQGAERELDSGVASQSSGMFSPGEEKKSEGQGHVLPPGPDDSPAVAFSDSTTAVYDAESSHRSLDLLSPQECWSGALEEDLPLDSSSVHEDCPELEQLVEEQHFPPESGQVTDIQSDVFVTDASVPRCEVEELLKSSLAPSVSSHLSFLHQSPVLQRHSCSNPISKSEHQAPSRDEAKSDPSYQILRLPFESILTPAAAGAGRLSSPGAPYFYNYLSMQSTHERMSVLSPSLDELSSRDEMFSTDLDDVELFPKHVYTGRRLAEVVGASPQAAAEEVEEVWLPDSKRFMCACCGRNLAKGAGRNKGQSSAVYRDEAGDSEEEGRYGRGCEQPVRVVVRKHSAPRKPHAVPPRPAAKPWYKRNQYKDALHPFDQDGGHDLGKQDAAGGELGVVSGSELQFRTCEERVCREDLTTEKSRWAEGEVIPRRRQGAALPRQATSSQRKVMYQRPRDEDNDDEPPPLHCERGPPEGVNVPVM